MVGQTILHYRILEEIGQGGMGVVYKAEDTKLKRTVALKFLLPHILSSDKERERFLHEAQAAAALHHPNICTIYEINEADGQTFISMAHLEGRSLLELIDEGPLPAARALNIALQVAQGLRAAHEKGIIHRDIKASNIMLSGDGRATIMDFGLAKSGHQTQVTQVGTTKGTIAYMSPEQTRGERVGAGTDIWSLGVLLYEMLTGQRPFRGGYGEAVVYSILNEEPIPLGALAPDVPEDVEAVVRRAMAKDPDHRYRTMGEFAVDLEELYEGVKAGSSSRRRMLIANGAAAGGDSLPKALFGPSSFTTLLVYSTATLALTLILSRAGSNLSLPPDAPRFALVLLLSLIPTVWLLAARRRASPRNWSAFSKVGIPANLVLSLVLLAALFTGRDLGAATETVTVFDEEGNPVERVVPKSEYRRSALLYLLDNETGQEEHLWVGGAVIVLLQMDLFQDHFITGQTSVDDPYRERLAEAGYTSGFGIPWNLKRKIAEDANLDYLLTGSYTREGGEWILDIDVHETVSGKLISNKQFRSSSLFEMADELSLSLRHDMGLPDGHIDSTPDLPVDELFTASEPALMDLCRGIYQALYRQDWGGAVVKMERAVEQDSTFAWGYFTLYQMYIAANVKDKADPAMRNALRYVYKLPERLQFLLKANYYQHVEDPEKILGVVKMWVDLYPDDIGAREVLAVVRLLRNERELALEQYETILAIDPSRSEYLLDIGDLYRAMGDFERTVESYEAYLKKHPDNAEAYHTMGGAYEGRGRYEEARKYYEKALIADPNRGSVLVDLGDIEGKLGNDDKATELYEEALAKARTPQERVRVYRSKRNFYSNRGRMRESLEQMRLVWSESAKYMPPVTVLSSKLEDLWFLARAGQIDEAFRELESIEAGLAPPWDGLLPIGYLTIYTQLEDPGKLEKYIEELRTFIAARGEEQYMAYIYWAEGKMEEARGNYRAAIENYRRKLDLNPNDIARYRSIGRCYRKLGDYQAAIGSVQKMLDIYPNNPTANYEMALACYGAGDREKAMEHLKKALDRYRNADPEFKPAQDARTTLAEWESQI